MTVGVTASQIVGAAYTRRRIKFHPPANNRVTISQDPNPVLDAGPTLQQAQAPVEYADEDGYSGVAGPWYAIANVAGVTIGITEVFGP